MRKLMFSPKTKAKKLTRRKEADSRPGTAESTVSSIDDLSRSPRPSLSSADAGITNSRHSFSITRNDPKLRRPSVSDRPSTATVITNGISSLPKRMASIRPVNSFDDGPPRMSAESSLEASPSLTNGRSNSVLSSSPNSNASIMSPPTEKQQQVQNGSDKLQASRLRRKVSDQYLNHLPYDASPRAKSNAAARPIVSQGAIEVPQRESSIGGAERSAAKVNAEAQEDASFDSAVGKAGLGKTGRVMNRLISENEALKRDIQIEKLKSEESRQAAKLLEDKMERTIADYESRLLEANVTKTLLARKERQVESLQEMVDLEKKRTSDAQGKERTWKGELEKMRDETTKKVEEATTRAALMEGRYTAISDHWKDQGEEVKRATTKMGKEISQLVEARKKDDEKITTLRDLCDQQDTNIKELLQQKEALAQQFEAYKKEQEEILRDIKKNALERESSQQQMLNEAKETLDKLKWALNVKNKLGWAE